MTDPTRTPTPEMVTAYRRDGAVLLPGLVSHRWVQLLRAGVRKNRRAPTANGHDIYRRKDGAAFFEDAFVWPYVHEYRTFLLESGTASVAGTLMETTQACLFFDNVFVKDAGVGVPTPWHQDIPAISMDGRLCSLWIALDEVARGESLEFIAGSHRWGTTFRPVRFSTGREETGSNHDGSIPRPDFDSRRDRLTIRS